MRLIEILGLAKEPALTEEQRVVVTSQAREFFRAGGSISPSDWPYLSEAERSILKEASSEVFVERMKSLLAPPRSDPEGVDQAAQTELDLKMDAIEKRR